VISRYALSLAALCLPASAAAQAPGADPAPAEPEQAAPHAPITPVAEHPQRRSAEETWLGPFKPAEPASKTDPLFPTAIAELIAAGSMLALGGLLWGTAVGEERCGAIAGCVDVMDYEALRQREAGVTLVGLGSGFAVFGSLSLGLLAADPLEPGEERDAPGAAVAGHLLFATGISTFAAGFVHGAAADPRTSDYTRAWPFYVFGLTAAAVGIPLFVGGVSREDEHERLEEQLRQRRASKTRPFGRPTTVTLGPTGGSATWDW
jgi:hypothetical protein